MVVINQLRLGQTLVPNVFIDKYLTAASGEHVKVYLMLLRQLDNVGLSVPSLADALELTEKDVIRSLNYWERQGLISLEYENGVPTQLIMLSPAMDQNQDQDSHRGGVSEGLGRELAGSGQTGNAVPHTSSQTASATDISEQPVAASPADFEDPEFKTLLYVASQLLGRPVTKTDASFIMDLLGEYHFSTELVEYLIEYCADRGHTALCYIKAVANGWREAGVKDVPAAKAQVASFDEANHQNPKPSNRFGNFDQRKTDLNALV